jgi:hypothetical protein
MTSRKQADMSRNTNARVTSVRMKKPTRTIRLRQKAGIVAGVFRSDQRSPTRNPEESAALNLRKTNVRNGVTTSVPSSTTGVGVNRMLGVEGLSKKPTPSGKLTDMLTWTR